MSEENTKVKLEVPIQLKRTTKPITNDDVQDATLKYGEALFLNSISGVAIGRHLEDGSEDDTVGSILNDNKYLTPFYNGGKIGGDITLTSNNNKFIVEDDGTYYLGNGVSGENNYKILTSKDTISPAEGGTGLSELEKSQALVSNSSGTAFEFRNISENIDVNDTVDDNSLVTVKALDVFVTDKLTATLEDNPITVEHGGTGIGEVPDGSLLVGTGGDTLSTIDITEEDASFNGVLLYGSEGDGSSKHSKYELNDVWNEDTGLLASKRFGDSGAISKSVTFRSMLKSEGAFVLTEGVNYGDTLPTTGVPGQVFFKKYVG